MSMALIFLLLIIGLGSFIVIGVIVVLLDRGAKSEDHRT
jgi:hypothetical protein